MFINECELYREFYPREFEWKSIREAGAQSINKSKKSYPLRFEFLQPLRFKEYNFERGGFEILDEYKILGIRRFEALAINVSEKICGMDKDIAEYPRGLVLELSRPFNLEFVEVDPELAKAYTEVKSKNVNNVDNQNFLQKNIYEARDAYMALKVKIYAYKGLGPRKDGILLANVLAVLEGIDIYADRDRQNLLFSETYRQRTKTSSKENLADAASVKDMANDLDLTQPLFTPTRTR